VQNPLSLAEKIFQQSDGSAIRVRHDFADSVEMAVIELSPRAGPVGVVDSIDTSPLRIMKREAVFDSVRAALRRGHLASLELDRITFAKVEFVTVKTQQRLKLVVRTASHPIFPPPVCHILS